VGAGVVICLERGADLHTLSSVKSRLVLPFWYRLTRVVPDKGPLNVCVRVRVHVCVWVGSHHTVDLSVCLRAWRYLITSLQQQPVRPRNINDVMPMIGARFYSQLDATHLRNDVLEHALARVCVTTVYSVYTQLVYTQHVYTQYVYTRCVYSSVGSVSVIFHYTKVTTLVTKVKKGKGSPYSITERRVPELSPVLGSQPTGDVSHKPDGRLPLLSARPAVTPTTLKRAATSFVVW